MSPFEPEGSHRGLPLRGGSGILRYKKPHATLTPGNTIIFVPLCLGVKYDGMDNRLTQRHQATKEDLSGRAANCFVARARVVPHRTRTGTCSKRRPGATTCTRSVDRPGRPSRPGAERGHVPSAVRGATTCTRSNDRRGRRPHTGSGCNPTPSRISAIPRRRSSAVARPRVQHKSGGASLNERRRRSVCAGNQARRSIVRVLLHRRG